MLTEKDKIKLVSAPMREYSSCGDYFEKLPLINKKVAILIPGYYSANGGMFEYALSGAHDLKIKGYEVKLFLNASFANQKVRYDDVVIVPDRLGIGYKQKLFILSAIAKNPIKSYMLAEYRKALKEFSPGIIWHTENHFFSSDMMEFYRDVCPSSQLVYTVHDPIYHDENINLVALRLRRRTDRRIVKLSQCQNVHVHVHKLELTDNSVYEGCQNMFSAPHAPVQPFAERLRPHYSSVDMTMRIGFMGRIERYKGITDFIEAGAIVGSHFNYDNRLEFEITGRGELPPDIDTKLRPNLKIYNSYVSDEDFHKHMANLDLLILPYWEATWSAVASMAVSYGVPVIATSVGAMPEVISHGENGYLVEPKSPMDIAGKVIELMENPEKLSELRVSS